MKKRLLAIMLCLVFVASLLPISAWAADSGTCGENLTWSFDRSTGILTISGTGAMGFEQEPWFEHRSKITEVIIQKGCTYICQSAFATYRNLHTVTLPSTLNIIGPYAFINCSMLSNVNLDYVTEIQNCALKTPASQNWNFPSALPKLATMPLRAVKV